MIIALIYLHFDLPIHSAKSHAFSAKCGCPDIHPWGRGDGSSGGGALGVVVLFLLVADRQLVPTGRAVGSLSLPRHPPGLVC